MDCGGCCSADAPAIAVQLPAFVPSRFDADYGGFGGPPKFPRPCEIQLLLRAQDRLRVRGEVAGS